RGYDRNHRKPPFQPGLRITKRNTPLGCLLASSSSHPVVWQKCWKSWVAPGSVASTSSTAPGASGFNARRAFSTGNGHSSPVASRVASTVKLPSSAISRHLSEAQRSDCNKLPDQQQRLTAGAEKQGNFAVLAVIYSKLLAR